MLNITYFTCAWNRDLNTQGIYKLSNEYPNKVFWILSSANQNGEGLVACCRHSNGRGMSRINKWLKEEWNKIGGCVLMKYPFTASEIPKIDKFMRWKKSKSNHMQISSCTKYMECFKKNGINCRRSCAHKVHTGGRSGRQTFWQTDGNPPFYSHLWV